MKKVTLFGVFAVAALATASVTFLANHYGSAEAQQPAISVDRLLHVPSVNYRTEWVLLGSYSVLSEDPAKGAKELHVVYGTPETVEVYRKTGNFPDGAKLVKDVFATNTKQMTTGTASFAKQLIGRFVMVKDATNKHAGTSALWGDGWGWAFYAKDDTTKTVTSDYKTQCLACHEPARGKDLIYAEGYPVLAR